MIKKLFNKYFYKSIQHTKNNNDTMVEDIKQVESCIQQQQIKNEQKEQKIEKKDHLTFAQYKIIRNRFGQLIDLEFSYANERLIELLGENPIGKRRSAIMPINNKVCKYIQNVIDIGISKHFSYQDSKFGFINAIIELSNKDEYINIYTVDVDAIRNDNLNEANRKNINTILSMLNVSIMHFNIVEHYVYNDSILTTYFNENNPDLYIGQNVHSSYDLFKSLDVIQQELVENELNKIRRGEQYFASFTLIVQNSLRENIECKVIIMPEDNKNMYLIAVQY